MSSPRTRLVLLAAACALLLSLPSARAVDPACRESGPGGFTVTLCLNAPLEGDVLTGDTAVAATVQVSGSQTVPNVTYFLDGNYLLMDVSVPPNGSGIAESTFTLPVSKFADGPHVLSVRASVKGSGAAYSALPAEINLGFLAGGETWNPETFMPPDAPGAVTVMATGDGADGNKKARSVANMINDQSPDLFLYLGDVYDQGSISEFTNWYPLSFGIPALGPITAPTIGNHEYEATSDARGYFDYWGYPSHYYSFEAGGWHIVSLDSTTQFTEFEATAQYDWLVSDLDAHNVECTLVFFHHPTYSLGQFSGAPWMSQVWSLMADEGVDLVVNGHAHNYQRWVSLDRDGDPVAPGAYGVTEIVAGTGGHALYSLGTAVDPRVAHKRKAYGALKLELGPASADFQFLSVTATVLDSGTVGCSPPQDDIPPLPPSVAADPAVATRVDLTWSEASDDVGVTRYEVSRNGLVIANPKHRGPPERVQNFSDYTAAPATTYSYAVEAFDAEGNGSGLSLPAEATTPTSADSTLPSQPGSFTAIPLGAYEIDLSWTESSDDSGVPPVYDIVRDGDHLATTALLSYVDTEVVPGTSYSYELRARDGSNNSSDPAATAEATTPEALFVDGFESDWAPWTTHAGLSLWQEQVYSGGWSAHGPSTTTKPRHATKAFAATHSDLFAQARVDLLSQGANSVDLIRFRRADGIGMLKVYVNASGFLAIKNEFNGNTTTSAVNFTMQDWHTLKAHVIVNGASGRIEVWLDGQPVPVLTKTINMGTELVGIFQVGDANAGRTYDVIYDEVTVDTSDVP